jgi:outer membrane protein assembly complex protein YaeT
MNARAPCCVLAALLVSACHEELGIGQPVGERLEVESLTFSGVDAMDESALRGVLATKESPWLPWRDARYFDRDAFSQDLERIVAYYEDQGYPDAEVTSYDVDVDGAENTVRLHVAVAEGDPLRVAAIELRNFEAIPGEVRARLRTALPIETGQPLVAQRLAESGEVAARVLKEHGYPWASVDVERQPRNGEVAVILEARPGNQAFFGRIDIVGNYSVGDDVIRRQLLYRPGERFRQSAIRESLRQLYALELFQFANIELVQGDGTPHEVESRVVVTEGDHRKLEFSLGYGTEEKARVEAEWRHVNFYGGARTAGIHGKWSWLDRGVEANFVQPYLFSPQLSLALQGQAWYADEPAFDALTRGGRATVTRVLGPNSTAWAYYAHQFQSSRIANEALLDPKLRDVLISLGLDPTTGVQDGVLSSGGVGTQLFRVDSTLDPTRGYFASLELEQAGGWLPGTYNYLDTRGELRGYVTPRDGLTLAGRVRYGSINPFGRASDVPFFRRYFLGGASSLRGWGRYEVSPLSGSGLPIGGHSLFETSAEARLRVWNDLGVVAFVDAGNVWPGVWTMDATDLLYDAGTGLRYKTPFGAVRLDFAYQLTRLEGLRIEGKLQERRWRLHFSIGQAF